MELKLKAYAKINLSLDVLKRREDGYHEVSMIMQQIELHDKVNLVEVESGIELEILENNNIPVDERNTAYKAAKLMIDKYNIKKGIKIIIEKNIPDSAGLAGGSSDAAAVINGMNSLFDINADVKELMKIGKEIGADVPFCIMGGTALAEGIGEKLTPLKNFKDVKILITKPEFGISTPYVYKSLKLDKLFKHPENDKLLKYMENYELEALADGMYNVLETVTGSEHTEIGMIEKIMMDNGAIGSMMSGSGPTVFGIFKDDVSIKSAAGKLKESFKKVFITKTI